MTEKKNQNKVFVFKNVNVAPYVSKKMNLSYLNWAFVVATLRSADSKASFKVKQYPEIDAKTHQLTGRKVNYFADVNGCDSYVTVTVTFRGQSLTESLPCYNYSGKVPEFPDGLLVNKTAKRCLTKAAAMLTGLGISLYINGSTEIGDNNNQKSFNNHSNYHRSNGSRNYRRSNNNGASNKTNAPSSKQINFIKNLLKQAKSDGSKAYVYLYSNRNHLQNALTSSSASEAIKFLQKLVKYQRSNSSDKQSGNYKQTTLIK